MINCCPSIFCSKGLKRAFFILTALTVTFFYSYAQAQVIKKSTGGQCVTEYYSEKLIKTGDSGRKGGFDYHLVAGLGAAGFATGIFVTCCAPVAVVAGVIGAAIGALFGDDDDDTGEPMMMQTFSYINCHKDKITNVLTCELGFKDDLKPDILSVSLRPKNSDSSGIVYIDMQNLAKPVFSLYYGADLNKPLPSASKLITSTASVNHKFLTHKVYDPTTTDRRITFGFDLDDVVDATGNSINFGFNGSGVRIGIATRGTVPAWGFAYSEVEHFTGSVNDCSAEFKCSDQYQQDFNFNVNGAVPAGSISGANQPWSVLFDISGSNVKIMDSAAPADPNLKTPSQIVGGAGNLEYQKNIIVSDNANGGSIKFNFAQDLIVDQVDLLNLQTETTVIGYDENGVVVYSYDVPLAGSNPANSLVQFHINDFSAAAGNKLQAVRMLEIKSNNRFAVAKLKYCPFVCPWYDACGICKGPGKDMCGNCPGDQYYNVPKDMCGFCPGDYYYNHPKDKCGICPEHPDYNKGHDKCGYCPNDKLPPHYVYGQDPEQTCGCPGDLTYNPHAYGKCPTPTPTPTMTPTPTPTPCHGHYCPTPTPTPTPCMPDYCKRPCGHPNYGSHDCSTPTPTPTPCKPDYCGRPCGHPNYGSHDCSTPTPTPTMTPTPTPTPTMTPTPTPTPECIDPDSCGLCFGDPNYQKKDSCDRCPQDPKFNDPICDNDCGEQDVTNVLFARDGFTHKMRNQTMTYIRRARRVLNRKFGGANSKQNKRINNLRENANSLQVATWSLVWSIDRIQETCNNVSESCITVSNVGTLNDTITQSEALLANVNSAFKFYKGIAGKRKRIRRPLNVATQAHKDSVAFGEQIPEAQNLCD